MARKLQNYPEISLNEYDFQDKIDFDKLFGRTGAIHIEIGSGKGTFLLSQGRAHPEINFLGIEWASKYCRHAIDRLGRWDIKNVKMLRTDAAVFINEHIAEKTVDCWHIYFPDPWPKARHNKRRFICKKNLELLIKCTKPNGIIQLATDHLDYFQWMLNAISQCEDKLTKIDFVPAAGAKDNEAVGTNFERKYIKETRTINTIALKVNK